LVNLKTEDEADALAIAICHINNSPLIKWLFCHFRKNKKKIKKTKISFKNIWKLPKKLNSKIKMGFGSCP
jgi:hypothetical protein